MAADAHDELQHTLAILRSDGVCRVPNVLAPAELARCCEMATERYQSILRAILLKQMMGGGGAAPARFAEAVERDGGRLDVRHSPDDAIVRALLVAKPLRRLLQAALGEDAECVAAGNVVAMSMEGWLTSLAPSDDDEGNVVLADNLGPMTWHADGPHLFEGEATLPAHALTCFVPLVDLTLDNGATEFAIGSHVHGHEHPIHVGDGDLGEASGADATVAGGEANASPPPSQTTTILARAGDAIVFDYRLWHRGTPNCSDVDRQLLYVVVGKPWWEHARS